MKNKQKGFIVPIALVIVALLVVGGGVYFYFRKNDSKIIVNNQNSNTESNTSNKELPDYWPSDIPVYPNAEVVTYTGPSNPSGRPGTEFVSFETNDSLASVIDFYKASLPANGWEVNNAGILGEAGIVGAFKNLRKITINIGSGNEQTYTSISFILWDITNVNKKNK